MSPSKARASEVERTPTTNHIVLFRSPVSKVVTSGASEAQFPGRRITMGAPKSPDNVTNTFFNAEHLLPKDLRFELGGAKLASCTGRHLNLLQPCLQGGNINAKDRHGTKMYEQ